MDLNPLRVLPDVLSQLRAIGRATEHMDQEVTAMNASVQRIEGEISTLNGRIAELRERMEGVEAAVERLEPHVADVNLAMRPLRRARARLPARGSTAPADAGDSVA